MRGALARLALHSHGLPQTIMPIPNHPSATDPAPILQLREPRYAAERIATALLHADLFTRLPEIEGTSPQAAAVRN
jgi:hypothetical protein